MHQLRAEQSVHVIFEVTEMKGRQSDPTASGASPKALTRQELKRVDFCQAGFIRAWLASTKCDRRSVKFG